MDEVGNGPYGWTMSDIGEMEDMDGVVNIDEDVWRCGRYGMFFEIRGRGGIVQRGRGSFRSGATIDPLLTMRSSYLQNKKMLFAHFLHQ